MPQLSPKLAADRCHQGSLGAHHILCVRSIRLWARSRLGVAVRGRPMCSTLVLISATP